MLSDHVKYHRPNKSRLSRKQCREIAGMSRFVAEYVADSDADLSEISSNIGSPPAGMTGEDYARCVGNRTLGILIQELNVQNIIYDLEASEERSRTAELLGRENSPGALPDGVAGVRLIFRRIASAA